MDTESLLSPLSRRWLESSVLWPHASEYYSYLRRRRHSAQTTRAYVRCVAHFAYWISQEQTALIRVNESAIQQFLAEHLPQCHCARSVHRYRHMIRAALKHLLVVLRASGVIRECRKNPDLIHTELVRFDQHMEQVLGLALNTRKQRSRIVHKFLAQQFGSGSIAITSIKATDVLRFVVGRESQLCAGSMNVVGGALRCYFRFRALVGDKAQALLEAVPSVAHWRLATLPEVFSEQQVRQLLDSFQGLSFSPKRAYAMVRCLTDLGLRASEVARLHLDDIDWRAGMIRLAANKSRRVDVLPLPIETGRAIADYLRRERPQTANRAVFVRHVAPYDEPIGAGVVRRHVREAYQRCGWTHSRVHILRHSMAHRLLRAGTSLKEIADLLRHRSLDTSTIYTKVDTNQLAAVALPWLGRMS